MVVISNEVTISFISEKNSCSQLLPQSLFSMIINIYRAISQDNALLSRKILNPGTKKS